MAINLIEQSSASVPTPASGKDALFIDSADQRLKRKDSTGAVSIIEQPVGAVTSVYGRTGAVVAVAGDYDASEVSNTPSGNIIATNVQSAINELDTEKLDTSHQGAGGAVHAVATTLAAGFMAPLDKSKLDGIAPGATNTTLSNLTPNPIGTASSGINSEAARIDHVHAHGDQGGGSQHLDATTLLSGFMSASDKTKLNGIASGATSTPLSASSPVNVSKSAASVGVSTDAARSDHKHDIETDAPVTIGTLNVEGTSAQLARADHVHSHGNQSGGSLHADATTLSSGFMSAADKVILDSLNVIGNGSIVPNEVSASVVVPDDYTWTRQTGTRFTGSISITLQGTGRLVFR